MLTGRNECGNIQVFKKLNITKGEAMRSNIKVIREKLGMSQEELAAKAGVSRVTLSCLETGTAEAASTKTLLKIATALDATIEEVFSF